MLLNLCGTGIGPVGAESLAASLTKNTTLLHLDIGGNKIGDAGSVYITNALTVNNTLQHLNIDRI